MSSNSNNATTLAENKVLILYKEMVDLSFFLLEI